MKPIGFLRQSGSYETLSEAPSRHSIQVKLEKTTTGDFQTSKNRQNREVSAFKDQPQLEIRA